jgi:hypothetical protein
LPAIHRCQETATGSATATDISAPSSTPTAPANGELLTITGLADRIDNLTQALDASQSKCTDEKNSAESAVTLGQDFDASSLALAGR